MPSRHRPLDPEILAAVRQLLEERRPAGVARQEIQGPHGLDAETARAYLREAGAIGHGGRGARWYLPTTRRH
ncbi:unannotated protein [freshwater metagenome]|uniref:Unannotated protein n=1 Tax=freshwater metagenome TaxID=449393 RepID=A0A6J7FG26_9ZZZZ|nr:hypothetical protein [Actinomycetota bacterium]